MFANIFFGLESLIFLWAFFFFFFPSLSVFPTNLDSNLVNPVSKFGYEKSSGLNGNRSELLFGLSLRSSHFRRAEPEEGRMI